MLKFKKRDRLEKAYHEIFNTQPGQIVLHDLLRFGFIFQTTHVPGDPNLSAFNEGRRSVALRVLDMLERKTKDAQELVSDAQDHFYQQNQGED